MKEKDNTRELLKFMNFAMKSIYFVGVFGVFGVFGIMVVVVKTFIPGEISTNLQKNK